MSKVETIISYTLNEINQRQVRKIPKNNNIQEMQVEKLGKTILLDHYSFEVIFQL